MKNKNTLHTELWMDRENVDRVSSFKFLGVHISEDLTWSLNTSHLIKKAQKCLFHLRTLKRNRLPQKLLINFYNCTIKYVLTYGCTVWYSSCTAAENMTFSGWLKQLSGLPALHSRTWATSTQAASTSGPQTSLRTTHTRDTPCSASSHQAGWEPSEPEPTDSKTASFQELWIPSSNINTHTLLS